MPSFGGLFFDREIGMSRTQHRWSVLTIGRDLRSRSYGAVGSPKKMSQSTASNEI